MRIIKAVIGNYTKRDYNLETMEMFFGMEEYPEVEIDLILRLIDDAKEIITCSIPQQIFEEHLKTNGIFTIDAWEIAGYEIVMQIGEEINKEDIHLYNNFLKSFSLIFLNKKGFYIESFSINSDVRNKVGRDLYTKIYNYNKRNSFQGSEGTLRYGDTSYDTDACFGGEKDAYWNLD